MTKRPAPRRASRNTLEYTDGKDEKEGVTFFARTAPADCYFRDADHVTEEAVRARIDELIEDALKDAAGVVGSRSDARDAFFADPYRARYR